MITTRRKLTKPFRRPRCDGFPESLPRPQTPEEEENEQCEEEEAHTAAVREAYEWLEETIRQTERWTDHQVSQIRLECPYTWPELRLLGRLPRAEGVPKCQAIIRVPVIYDEIGLFIWSTLAAIESDGPDGSSSIETEDYDKVADETRQKRSEAFLASLDQRFRFDRSAAAASSSGSGAAKDITERERTRRDSPPVSPMGTTILFQHSLSSPPPTSSNKWVASQDCWFCRHESIEEVHEENNNDDEDEDDQDDDVSMHGNVSILERIRLGRSGDGSFSNITNTSTDNSNLSARAGRPRARSGSFGEKVSSILGSLSKNVVTALGESLPRGQSRRTLFLNRGRMGLS